MTLRATYRLQFHEGFRFADGAELAPYLADLGVSHVYASPVFAARPGSTHGYDVTDPNAFNPSLGGEEGFREMVAAFRARGLGLILDIVPNHMGIGGATNRFWLDVLEWGPESPFADWFDIDWGSAYPGLSGKVLVPFLGDAYGDVLEAGGLEFRFDRTQGSFAVWAHDTHKLPVRPRDYAVILRAAGMDSAARESAAAAARGPADDAWIRLRQSLSSAPPEAIDAALAAYAGTPGDLASWSALDALIDVQNWRASKFNLDCDAINYRRFFTISDLAGVRVERSEVFDATHRLILSLLGEGVISGVRIDHIDGLRDPKAYALRLRERGPDRFFLHVEKILAPDEDLPGDWRTDGTTGYEFANLLVGLLADPAGADSLTATYADFAGRRGSPAEVAHAAKLEVMKGPMAAELEAIVTRLVLLAARDPRRRDLGRGAIRSGLALLVADLDVYRTYADAEGMDPVGGKRLGAALDRARRRGRGIDPGIFDFLGDVLAMDPDDLFAADRAEVIEIAMRFQQFSGPVMAKGLEDAALYRSNRLIAFNEVGGSGGSGAVTPEMFHRANAERLRRYPFALLATSTHDTKRGEDARTRIAALTSHAPAWRDFVLEWGGRLCEENPAVDRNEAYFMLQLLLGVWPADQPADDPPPGAALSDLRTRVKAGLLKSAREAGVNTRWVFGDRDYEAALEGMVDSALDPEGDLLPAFRAFERDVAPDGAELGLIQTILKLTVPGVPDIYQGAELWEQSLVDPDNRRPVNFDRRKDLLATCIGSRMPAPGEVRKLHVTGSLLRLRRDRPDLFAKGAYEPVTAIGPAAGGICAFARRHGADTLLVAVALHPSATDGDSLAGSALTLPEGTDGPYVDVFTGEARTDLSPAALFRDNRHSVLLSSPGLRSTVRA